MASERAYIFDERVYAARRYLVSDYFEGVYMARNEADGKGEEWRRDKNIQKNYIREILAVSEPTPPDPGLFEHFRGG